MDPILSSIKKYKANKRLVFENQERSLDVKSSKFVKQLLQSINDVIKNGIVIQINSFKYNYPNYVKILGTFDGSITWMFYLDDKSSFMIKNEDFVRFDSKKAEELKKLTIFFESDNFYSQINQALQNKSFS